MDIYKVTRVEAPGQMDRAAGYVPRTIPGNDLPSPGGNVNGDKMEAVVEKQEKVQITEAVRVEISTAVPTYAKIKLDPDSHLISIQIYNAQTNEIIRQIPAEEIARLSKNTNLRTGILVEKKQ